jgi:type IV secretion system protein VirB5
MQAAMATASTRFAELQALIDQIDRTSDSKGSADLQGRIAAEQAMATNETAKLAATAAWTDANIASAQTRASEAALAAHGTFAARFHPAAP